MISYNNSDVVQYLRQYDMFANSLNLIKNDNERNMIVKQLTKLEEKIISLTNDIYEEEYNALVNHECDLFDDERKRLNSLVELINQRLSYVEKRCNNHYQLTGDSINVNDVLGADKLDIFENKIRIIDKYLSNIKLEKDLEEDIKSLTNKIALASEKIDINQSLNVELENTFKETLNSAFADLNLYDVFDRMSLRHVIEELKASPSYQVYYLRYNSEGSRMRKKVSFYNTDANKRWICCTVRDVTENFIKIEKQKQKIEEALQIAKSADKSKSEFLTHVSREIRTPLSSVMGSIQLARKEIEKTDRYYAERCLL